MVLFSPYESQHLRTSATLLVGYFYNSNEMRDEHLSKRQENAYNASSIFPASTFSNKQSTSQFEAQDHSSPTPLRCSKHYARIKSSKGPSEWTRNLAFTSPPTRISTIRRSTLVITPLMFLAVAVDDAINKRTTNMVNEGVELRLFVFAAKAALALYVGKSGPRLYESMSERGGEFLHDLLYRRPACLLRPLLQRSLPHLFYLRSPHLGLVAARIKSAQNNTTTFFRALAHLFQSLGHSLPPAPH